jgi:hypothetical protein
LQANPNLTSSLINKIIVFEADIYSKMKVAKGGAKLGTAPHTAPHNAIVSAALNGLDIEPSPLHSEEVDGASSRTESLLALFGEALAWGDHPQDSCFI